ncbi:MAG: hypothetical protein RLQ12_04440 [Cyclobacteriaceae bacterium]
MKEQSSKWLLPGLVVAVLILISSDFKGYHSLNLSAIGWSSYEKELGQEALTVLESKCNVCHRKQNPLMVFKEKNIAKRASKIYRQVFLDKRMPKGDKIRLTPEEYQILEKWLFTQKIL